MTFVAVKQFVAMLKALVIFLAIFSLAMYAQTKGATLSGVVSDQSGAPAENAQVDLYSAEREWHTKTDVAGKFQFDGLSSGRYDLEVSSFGLRKALFRDIEVGSSSMPPMNITLRIRPASDCENGFSQMQYVDGAATPVVHGVVTFSSGRDVHVLPGAMISLRKSGSSSEPVQVQTNEQGEFLIVGLEPGLYTLKAVHDGYTDFSKSEVRIRSAKTLTVEFAMIPSGMIFVCQ